MISEELRYIGNLVEQSLFDCIHLLPAYSLNGEHHVAVKTQKRVSDSLKIIKWFAHSVPRNVPNGLAYKIDLLYFKRRLRELEFDSPNLEVEDLRDVRRIVGEESISIDNFREAVEQCLLTMFDLRVEVEREGKSESLLELLFRKKSFFASQTKSEKETGEEKIKTLIKFNKDYLNIIASEPKIEFDYDYLSTLMPVQMRFYELTQLLRNQPQNKSENIIQMDLNEFSGLMPLPQTKEHGELESQVISIVKPHLNNGYLKDYEIKYSQENTNVNPVIYFEF